MTFTKTPPTTPGFYAWRLGANSAPLPIEIINDLDSGGLIGIYRGTLWNPLTGIGEWCRLVPAEEVEKAFREGWNNRSEITGALPNMPWINNRWTNSRAKQVTEGTI